jgi:hypothetical protein
MLKVVILFVIWVSIILTISLVFTFSVAEPIIPMATLALFVGLHVAGSIFYMIHQMKSGKLIKRLESILVKKN